MAVKIRLARHGKKGFAFYHIVAADSRAPRDGKFIEKLGTYNPNTNPATIDLDFEKALGWLQKGAQPTDTCRAILSYKGVLYKKHLLGGVAKGAFSETEAEARFNKWLSEKAGKIEAKSNKLATDAKSAEKARLAAEAKIKEERAKAIAEKKAAAEAAAKEAHANVPVIDRDEVGAPVLRDDTVVMSVGSARTLLYDLDPWYTTHKDVIWSSDNEEVATVDQNGTVTAVGEGSCTITAAAKDDLTKVDTCAVHVSALDLSLEGIISAQSAGIGSVTGAATYKYDMVKSEPTFGTEKKITWPEEFQGFGQSLATSTMGRGSMWACEYDNTGMIYEIDPETGVVKDMLEPIDGDMMFGMTYSETTDLFTSIMNFYLYVDQPFTHEAEQEIIDSYDQEEHMFMWHRLDMSSYLKASDQNFQTGETGNGSIVDVVFCGITTLEGEGEQYLSQDYLGKYAPEISYKPTTTLVLLDNVGRLWYIDEMTDMKKVTGETGSTYFTDATGAMMIPESFNGVLSLGYDTDGDGTDDSYSVFVIRQIQETPLLDMYLDGTMPRITYHFSDVAFAGRLEDGTPMFVMSLYDYWNNGITNELYLYVPGHETDELDHETWQPIRTPDRLFDLGDTGEHNIVATIHKATVTGGVSVQTEADAEVVNTFCGFYQG